MTDEDQIEIHRDRWLTLFVGGYSMMGVVAGVGVGVAATLDSGLNKTAAIYCGIICVLFIVLLFWRLREFYDYLGFGKQPKSEQEMKVYELKSQNRARRGKKVRKVLEFGSHLFLVAHLVLLACGVGKKEANQPVEPTGTAVTDRADARSAPAVPVAH